MTETTGSEPTPDQTQTTNHPDNQATAPTVDSPPGVDVAVADSAISPTTASTTVDPAELPSVARQVPAPPLIEPPPAPGPDDNGVDAADAGGAVDPATVRRTGFDPVTVVEPEPEAPIPSSWDELALPASLRSAIDTLGWTSPTPVQGRTFATMVAGEDVLVQSQTGSGKTGAFCLPWLASRFQPGPARETGVQLIVLLPTRELAKQVCDELVRLAVDTPVAVLPVYGGTAMAPQLDALSSGVHAVVGTPGRILDHIRRRSLDLSKVNTVVLDECDEMLSMGFVEDIRSILSACPDERQTCLFSATVPREIERISRRHMRNPARITLSGDDIAAAEIDHAFYMTGANIKTRDLLDVVMLEDPSSAIVFCNTREETRIVASVLQKHGYSAEALSSDLTQSAREKVMDKFRDRALRFLVATDVAARGIDVSHVSHVINFSFPEHAEVYVHRTGRTGRAGRAGIALSIISPLEIGAFYTLTKSYKSIHFTERKLPPKEDLAATRTEVKLDRISREYSEPVSPEWLLLARRLAEDPRGERVVAYLLHEAIESQRLAKRSVDPDSEEGIEAAERQQMRERAPSRDERRGSRDRDQNRGRDRDRGPGRDRDRSRGPRDRDDREPRSHDRDRGAQPSDGERTPRPIEAQDAPTEADSRVRDQGRSRDDAEPRRRRRGRRDERPDTQPESTTAALGREAESTVDSTMTARVELLDSEAPIADAPLADAVFNEDFGGTEAVSDTAEVIGVSTSDDVETGTEQAGEAEETSEAEGDRPKKRRRRRRRRRSPSDESGDDQASAGSEDADADDSDGDSDSESESDSDSDSDSDETDTEAEGESVDADGEPKKRRRRRRRRGKGTATSAAPVSEEQRPAAAPSDEGGSKKKRRRRRRRGQSEDDNESEGDDERDVHMVAVEETPRVSQDEIIIDIDEQELTMVRDEFGEIDELDELTLKGRRRAVIEDLNEEMEVEDLTDRDAEDDEDEFESEAEAEAREALDGSDESGPTPAAREGSDDADASDSSNAEDRAADAAGEEGDEDDQSKKKRRRRRRKKKAVAAAPELSCPPHKDFWEVWASKFSAADFQRDEDSKDTDESVEDEPAIAASVVAEPEIESDVPLIEDVPDEDTLGRVVLNIGRRHGHKAAHVRALLRRVTGLHGKAVKDLTVRDQTSLFRMDIRQFETVVMRLDGSMVEDITLTLVRLSDDDEGKEPALRVPEPVEPTVEPTVVAASVSADAPTNGTQRSSVGNVTEVTEVTEAASEPVEPSPEPVVAPPPETAAVEPSPATIDEPTPTAAAELSGVEEISATSDEV